MVVVRLVSYWTPSLLAKVFDSIQSYSTRDALLSEGTPASSDRIHTLCLSYCELMCICCLLVFYIRSLCTHGEFRGGWAAP